MMPDETIEDLRKKLNLAKDALEMIKNSAGGNPHANDIYIEAEKCLKYLDGTYSMT